MNFQFHYVGACHDSAYSDVIRDGCGQDIYYNRYIYQSCWNVFHAGKTLESLFVSKPSIFNSPNSQYLEIIGFNLIDFMCFGDKRDAGIIQYSLKSMVVFFFQNSN